MNQNSILLRRRSKVIVPVGDGNLPVSYKASINRNLESLGYTLGLSVLDAIGTLSPDDAVLFYEELVTILKDLRGVQDYQPMYPNFPKQVMETSKAELYIYAHLHYLTAWISDVTGDKDRSVVWLPRFDKEARDSLEDTIKLKLIDLGTEGDLRQLITALMSSKTSISETDQKDLRWYAENYKLDLPKVFLNKEVLAFVGGLVPDNPGLKSLIKTATDVLRLAVSMSGGDVSLAEVTKFRSFSRRERKALLGLLENIGSVIEDMLRWKKRWIRLGERLHPGEYAKAYPNVAKAFSILRNDIPFPTLNSSVEAAVRNTDISRTVDLLRSRSGDFARRLDHLLRLRPEIELVGEFGEIAHGISTAVLLQLSNHFKNRNAPQDLRIFFPKGSLAKVAAIKYNLPELPQNVCEGVVRICDSVVIERFSKLPALGHVYIDEELKNYLVPFSQRSASRSLRTLVRGSKIDFATGADTIRFFLWWKEGELNGVETGRVDLDLSAVMYDGNWRYREHISYTNLKSANYQSCHSGDITSAPNGACEFIDIDIPSVLAYGGRYVVMTVNSYTNQKFSLLPECRAGWMMRQHPASGEVFEPATVQDKLDLTSETTICIPVVLDLDERKVVWADIGLKRHPKYVNNIEGNFSQVTLLGKSLTEVNKPNLYDLFMLHATARGSLVSEKSDADSVFSLETGVTPFDIERIVSEFL